ncbi:DNA modification methylase [Clostridium sp. USBA 49]|uniref:site-specific DNA-methyltransferase n=1 Tax=Eubacteriales TaxID=186802 RepID=UPI000999CBC5|nr:MULTISPECIES: site-specific DNA-methyltransferase [Eubacteriales]MBU5455273.1 DNA modification methylase [Caproiciproducens sp. MSJ-32]SKA84855.1 DNA modification methylase [Clostridium sp. USBA 49]
MQFRKLKIDSLIPAKYNPRKDLKPGDKEYEKIKNSLTEFGYVDPIIVNSDLTIIGGHQRWKVLKSLGYTEVDCVVIDIDKTKEKALNVALNKISGEWNEALLAELIKDLQSIDYDVSFTGFEPPEIEELFSNVHDKEIKEDDFDVEDALKEPVISKQGDLWLLGRHRLICGDSTKAETYEKLMDGKKANLVVTDPPYGVCYDGSQGTIKNDNLKDDEFYKFLLDAFKNMENNMADDASIYVFHADTKGHIFRNAFQDANFYLSGVCQWVKQSLVLGRSPYQWKHEPCLFGWKKKGRHNWYAGRKETTVWEFDKPSKSKLHSTMKPVALIAYPIKNSSLTNCIILEPFSGSGTTMVACEQTDRICYAIELDEKFVDVAVKRYIEQAGTDEEVFLVRDGVKIKYADIKKEGCD